MGGLIHTEDPLLTLAPLSLRDTDAYFALIARNLEHLTQHGDYQEMQSATPASVAAELSAPTPNHRFGIWRERELIGRVDLIPKGNGNAVIGYWLGEASTGRGYMTLACRALIIYAGDHLDVRAIYAGVTKGNRESEALLHRLGFSFVQDMGSYNRYRLELAPRRSPEEVQDR